MTKKKAEINPVYPAFYAGFKKGYHDKYRNYTNYTGGSFPIYETGRALGKKRRQEEKMHTLLVDELPPVLTDVSIRMAFQQHIITNRGGYEK